MQSAIRIRIYGDVHGVFFRAGTVSQAAKLDITGWVRNVDDGSVEVLAEGERQMLENLLGWCEHGPAGASVSKVEHEWVDATGKFANFRIRYD